MSNTKIFYNLLMETLIIEELLLFFNIISTIYADPVKSYLLKIRFKG